MVGCNVVGVAAEKEAGVGPVKSPGRLGGSGNAEVGEGLVKGGRVDAPARVAEALGELQHLVGLGEVRQPSESRVVGVGFLWVRGARRSASEEAVEAPLGRL